MRIFYTSLMLLLLCNTAAAEVYRWTDGNGRIHFGDKPNATKKGQTKNLSDRYTQPTRNFEVTVTPVNYDLPLDTKRKIITTVKKVFYILHEYNQIPFPEPTDININVFGSRKEFIAFRNKNSPGASSNSGYYSRKNNEAFIWKNRNVKKMTEVIIHEAFHAILWTNYKHIPKWLNEGFAEYFERINVFGTTAVINPSKGWKKVIKSAIRQKGIVPPLSVYMDMDWKQWGDMNKNDSLGYAVGWSLTFYLMSSKQGRKLIVDIFSEQKKNKEALVRNIVNDKYTGGIAQLQYSWENWLYGNSAPHRY